MTRVSNEFLLLYSSVLQCNLESYIPNDLIHLTLSYTDVKIWQACFKLFRCLKNCYMVHEKHNGTIECSLHLEMKKESSYSPSTLWVVMDSYKAERIWAKKLGTLENPGKIKGTILFGDLFGVVHLKQTYFYVYSYRVFFKGAVFEPFTIPEDFRLPQWRVSVIEAASIQDWKKEH